MDAIFDNEKMLITFHRPIGSRTINVEGWSSKKIAHTLFIEKKIQHYLKNRRTKKKIIRLNSHGIDGSNTNGKTRTFNL